MRYISIDIETTELNPNEDGILEFAAVYSENTDHYLHLIIPSESGRYNVSAVTAAMHSRLWNLLSDVPPIRHDYSNAVEHNGNKYCYVSRIAYLFRGWVADLKIDKIVVAGKNYNAFDKLFLEDKVRGWKDLRISHRTLDPASHYIREGDIVPPNLTTCLERAGLQPSGLHSALGDATDIVRLLKNVGI